MRSVTVFFEDFWIVKRQGGFVLDVKIFPLLRRHISPVTPFISVQPLVGVPVSVVGVSNMDSEICYVES